MGGMAEVYLAKNQGASGIAKFVAIKRILPQFSENPEFVDMFKAEAKIAVNLSHSNVVSIYEFGVEKSQFFLVMDFVDGRNLRQMLNKMKKNNASFSTEQILHLIKEVAAGLDHAHRCLDSATGKPLLITHRDMSPQNIMVSFEGEVKIVDFGIAKAESQIETTRAGTLKGKFGYMSPEQAEGLPVDLRTDIFSLGIVLWELIANDRLFIANNEMNTLRKIRDCNVPSLRKINPSVPQELERICNKALAKDRTLRYQTAAEFQRDLSRFLNRQYPDFSPHDFSSSVKTLYSEEILESRKKQVEFAQSSVGLKKEDASHEATSIVTDSTRTHTAPDHSQVHTQSDSIDLTPSDDLKIEDANLFFVKKPGDADLEKSLGNIPIPKSKSAPPHDFFNPAQRTTTPRSLPNAKVGHRPQAKQQLQIDPESSFAGSFHTKTHSEAEIRYKSGFGGQVFFILALLVGAFAFVSYRNPALLGHWVQVGKTQLAALQNKPTASTENASEEPTRLIWVNSVPPGAEILIDQKPASDLTPATVQVPRNRNVQISIHLAGYLPFSVQAPSRDARQTADAQPLQINATLVRARMGYIDVNVVGAGKLYVDDVEVADSGPLTNYPIRADQDVKIRVYDAQTQAGDQTTVRVSENRVKRITLIPKLTTR